jgi:hypothetical protein
MTVKISNEVFRIMKWYYIVMCMSLTIDWVLIDNRIYWTLLETVRDYILHFTITPTLGLHCLPQSSLTVAS